ncbi:hypothetical protein CDL60_17370 [Roseateles noduli]|nr:hypothetical protein CDL60_17370 [Roseateles noduli]
MSSPFRPHTAPARNAAAILLCMLIAASSTLAAPRALPGTFAPALERIRIAAGQRDYSALRAMMVEDFTWSFGGDGSADQAIEAWKGDSSSMPALAKAARMSCGWISGDIVQCPTSAKLGHRAGFKLVEGQWRMVYFVSGD